MAERCETPAVKLEDDGDGDSSSTSSSSNRRSNSEPLDLSMPKPKRHTADEEMRAYLQRVNWAPLGGRVSMGMGNPQQMRDIMLHFYTGRNLHYEHTMPTMAYDGAGSSGVGNVGNVVRESRMVPMEEQPAYGYGRGSPGLRGVRSPRVTRGGGIARGRGTGVPRRRGRRSSKAIATHEFSAPSASTSQGSRTYCSTPHPQPHHNAELPPPPIPMWHTPMNNDLRAVRHRPN